MLVIPAIDLLGGKCVRLRQGSFAMVKEYSENPVEVAMQFIKAGASLLHIVDLDGARAGKPINRQTILDLKQRCRVPLQVGGGIRTYEAATEYLKSGVECVILSTAATEDSNLIKRIIAEFGAKRIIVSVDVAADNLVMTRGWNTASELTLPVFLERLRSLSCKDIILTDTQKDGLLAGPNFDLVKEVVTSGFSVIAAGGISSLSDFKGLAECGATGAIVGKALYENKIQLLEAIALSRSVSPLPKRVIPCLDIKNGRVIKGVHFKDLHDAGDAVELGAYYSKVGADELVFLDVLATIENRRTLVELVERIAERINTPFTVGGGIKTLEQIRALLKAGADKVSLGSAAVESPDLVRAASAEFGAQCVVISLDAKRIGDGWHVYIKSGREDTGIDALTFARKMEVLGAGELLVNSLDRDGTKSGYDVPLLQAVNGSVNIPVIASSGAGKKEDFLEVLQRTNVDAVLAASLFHFGELTIPELKSYLAIHGIHIRL